MFAVVLAAAIAGPTPHLPVNDPCSFSEAAQAKGTPACSVDSRPATATPPALPVQCAGQPKDGPGRAAGRCVQMRQRLADGSEKTVWLWRPFRAEPKPEAQGR
jgi:hypothetical protein